MALQNRIAPAAEHGFDRIVRAAWLQIAGALADSRNDASPEFHTAAARQLVELMVFDAAARQRLVESDRRSSRRAASRCWSMWIAEVGSRLPEPLLGLSWSEVGCWAEVLDANCVVDRPETMQQTIVQAIAYHKIELSGHLLAHVHEALLDCRLQQHPGGRWRCNLDRTGRKRGGVFYTPEPVCRYIARRAVQIRRNRAGAAVDSYRLVDPACGGGAFLLAVCAEIASALAARAKRTDALSLVDRIHGIDLDPEAVVVARRAIWLWIVRRFPRADFAAMAWGLGQAIRCGDALVDPVLPVESGRYDVVLGNPPYCRELGNKARLDRIAQSDLAKYRAPRMDLWYYFVHRGLSLLRDGGSLGFIVNAYWTAGRGAAKLMAALRQEAHVEELFHLDDLPVFGRVSGRHLILLLSKGRRKAGTLVKRIEPAGKCRSLHDYFEEESAVTTRRSTPEALFGGRGAAATRTSSPGNTDLDQWPKLEQLGDIRQGIAENPASVSPRVNRRLGDRWKPGTGVFVLSDREVQGLGLSADERSLLRPYLQLADWDRYRLAARASRWLIYSTSQTCPDIERFPRLAEHLRRFRPIMEARRETRIGRRAWWQLHWPRDETLWLTPKILCRQMAARPGFVPTLGPAYVSFSANVFVPSPGREEHLYYWTALLNSRLLGNWFSQRAKRRGVGLEINGHLLRETPLRPVDFADRADRRRHDRLVELVGRRLSGGGNAEPPERTGSREQDPIEREIEALVCQGYGW